MNVLDIRTVTDVDNRPYQVADVLHEGAILPVSIPLYELHGVDVDGLANMVDVALAADELANLDTDEAYDHLEKLVDGDARQEQVQDLADTLRWDWDFTPFPKDMPDIDFDTVDEIPF
jgi:hypothetical protein